MAAAGGTLEAVHREADAYFRLHVRHPAGKVELEVSPRDTVEDLKRQLESIIGTAASEQRLLCRGALMAEERSLGSFGMRSGASILSVPLLRVPNKTDTEQMALFSPKRGLLMIPPTSSSWRPHEASRLSPAEHRGFYDSTTLPVWWQIQSSALA